MASHRSFIPSFLSLVTLVVAQQCTLQFDGRVPSDFVAATFDTAANTMFNPDFTFGANLSISDVVEVPCVTSSLFDAKNATKAVEVTIDDKSIFTPSADNVQLGFRRAELMITSNDGTDDSTLGVKTTHFSIMKDAARPLNMSHEYQLFFLESADFSTNQVVLKTGSIIGADTPNPDTLQLFGNVNSSPLQTLFSTNFTEGVFHNFAVTLDFDKNTTQVFYSQDSSALEAQTEPLANDVSGQGQYHFGVLKKGIGGDVDITRLAFQPAGIDEGIIYGGIFQEDSADGCISLSA
ncbi:uncharacterized protein BCR38DRAFT_334322 [Pseudomassariella vexata]|uniref:Glycoside hydrolase 131 catalytic N-terminal domain-containing protein n=1 Tax=Pseudomassariella vexata TaxID=1141098 RepID=A0A1Y2EG25_9PEZI|nr:uncharacterized protein BCR38DRAFT_334322 [Pseudomassariella vexata]ORY70519.1 hypothetical protein BCR38DRAFT_334322 [Pseudomassariella vexata]